MYLYKKTILGTVKIFLVLFILTTGVFGCTEDGEEIIIPFKGLSDITPIIEKIGGQRLVLLGESTHGTSEYYAIRAEISKSLIKDKGFSFIGVEGDWASIYRLNLYVKGLCTKYETAEDIMRTFQRWPKWMWANKETAQLVEWLKRHNESKKIDERIGFYGIDVYGQWEALDVLLAYIADNFENEDRELLKTKAKCFSKYGRDEQRYAMAVHRGLINCSEYLKDLVEIFKRNKGRLKEICQREYFRALQNAKVLKNAEDFYRLSLKRGPESWNSRATHFYHTSKRLLDYYGEGSRGIIWAHNTHVGDARATPMAAGNMVNIGMLARQDLGRDNVFIVGFSTYKGSVLAGRSWAGTMERMTIPKAVDSSLEKKLSGYGHENLYICLNSYIPDDHYLNNKIPHRAIGVVYNPEHEAGNYVPSLIPERYDALVFIKETEALMAL